MASQPANQLPLLYNDLRPLSTQEHGKYKLIPTEGTPHLATIHAVPVIVDEFIAAQRHYPIIFSSGDNPVPLALMGLNEGVNVFFDEKGALKAPVYLPAYLRRYPFMLAKLQPDADSLSLCFDPTSPAVGEGGKGGDKGNKGAPLFDGDAPSKTTQDILKFCEEFEMGAQRTGGFVKELQTMGLLIDGEVAIQVNDDNQPFIYRGFQMVDEAKVRDLKGDQLRKMNQSGMLALVMAHLFSLPMIREIFHRQVEQGKGPKPVPAEKKPAKADA